MPVSTDSNGIKGPIALGGSCPKGTTMGGSCKFACKDPSHAAHVLTSETRLVTSPPQDWSKVAISDMPVFCQWQMRSVEVMSSSTVGNVSTAAKGATDKVECNFVLRTVCCSDPAKELAPLTAPEVELNPVVRNAAKLAAVVDGGKQIAEVKDVVIKASGFTVSKTV